MNRKALIVWGGWDGHEPAAVAEIFRKLLEREAFAVEVSDSLSAFDDGDKLAKLDLIVPHWTMGTVTDAQEKAVCSAVRGGVGIAGCHGGMCDAFRNSAEWQFMTGGQWVAHPGNDGTQYTVRIRNPSHPITVGMEDFEVKSEQYYMHIDPAIKLLASTMFPVADGPHVPNGTVEMPVMWTKMYGRGRVFYNSLGHHADVIALQNVSEMMRRGFLWAASKER